MVTLETSPPALDENAHEFVSQFVSHVAAIIGYGSDRIVTIARVKALLLTALADDARASTDAWRALYRTITELVRPQARGGARYAHAYLQSFIHDNGDLAHD
jgi:hypothetical protein